MIAEGKRLNPPMLKSRGTGMNKIYDVHITFEGWFKMLRPVTLPEIRSRFDIALIRTPVRIEQVRLRREGMSPARLKDIKKALRTFHSFELLAGTTYRFQMTKKETEPERVRIAAMCNEMTHLADFQVKLYEYGWKPNKIRAIFWLGGMAIGTVTRILGIRAVLKSGVWLENRAVNHYKELLETVDWDDDSREMVEKNCSDEMGHVERWTALLAEHEKVRHLRVAG